MKPPAWSSPSASAQRLSELSPGPSQPSRGAGCFAQDVGQHIRLPGPYSASSNARFLKGRRAGGRGGWAAVRVPRRPSARRPRGRHGWPRRRAARPAQALPGEPRVGSPAASPARGSRGAKAKRCARFFFPFLFCLENLPASSLWRLKFPDQFYLLGT